LIGFWRDSGIRFDHALRKQFIQDKNYTVAGFIQPFNQVGTGFIDDRKYGIGSATGGWRQFGQGFLFS